MLLIFALFMLGLARLLAIERVVVYPLKARIDEREFIAIDGMKLHRDRARIHRSPQG